MSQKSSMTQIYELQLQKRNCPLRKPEVNVSVHVCTFYLSEQPNRNWQLAKPDAQVWTGVVHVQVCGFTSKHFSLQCVFLPLNINMWWCFTHSYNSMNNCQQKVCRVFTAVFMLLFNIWKVLSSQPKVSSFYCLLKKNFCFPRVNKCNHNWSWNFKTNLTKIMEFKVPDSWAHIISN